MMKGYSLGSGFFCWVIQTTKVANGHEMFGIKAYSTNLIPFIGGLLSYFFLKESCSIYHNYALLYD